MQVVYWIFVSLACFVCKDLFIRSVNNSCKTVAFPKIKVDNSPSTVPYFQIKTKKSAKFGKLFLLTKICMFVQTLMFCLWVTCICVILKKIKTNFMDIINIINIHLNNSSILWKICVMNYLRRKKNKYPKYPKSIRVSLNWRSTKIQAWFILAIRQ